MVNILVILLLIILLMNDLCSKITLNILKAAHEINEMFGPYVKELLHF